MLVTWTYVPPLFAVHPAFDGVKERGSSSTDKKKQPLPSQFSVDFTIRSHGIFHHTLEIPRSGYEDCADEATGDVVGPGRLITGLCALFERFIRAGPGALPSPSSVTSPSSGSDHHPTWRRKDDRGQLVHRATLTVQYPTGGAGLLPERLGAHYARHFRAEHADRCNDMIHPRSLASMLVSWYEASQWLGEDLGEQRGEDGQEEVETENVGEGSAAINWNALVKRVKEVRIGVEGESQDIF
jgi:hypothetical protein